LAMAALNQGLRFSRMGQFKGRTMRVIDISKNLRLKGKTFAGICKARQGNFGPIGELYCRTQGVFREFREQ